MTMNAIKKFPVSLTFDGIEASTNEFVVPTLEAASGDNLFLGIKSGKTHRYAAMSYTGKDVNASDVMEKLIAASADVGNQQETLDMLDDYLGRLKEFKVGNVLAVQYADGDYSLEKVANRPPRST